MRKTLLFLLLSIPVLAFGQIEGKGLVCNIEGGSFETIRGFIFITTPTPTGEQESKGWMGFFNISNDRAEWLSSRITKTELTPDYITIYVPDEILRSKKSYSFDRKLGVMSGGNFPDKEALCEVFINIDDYSEEMRRLENQYQAEYDKQREGNVL